MRKSNVGYCSLTNITQEEFILIVGGVEQAVLQPGETIKILKGDAELGAHHMAENTIIHQQTKELYDLMKKTGKTETELGYTMNLRGAEYNRLKEKALGKELVDYSVFSWDEIRKLAKEKNIKLNKEVDGTAKTKEQLIIDLKTL